MKSFPLRIRLKMAWVFAGPVPFKPLVPEMSLVRNKVMWSGSIRTAMRIIPEENYQRIVKAAGNQQGLYIDP